MAIPQNKAIPEVSVIIINYNTDQYILDLLFRIYSNDTRIEIIVVDNSDKNTLQEKLVKFPNVKYIFNNSNLGFAKANNVGVKQARGEWLYLLNSDTLTSGNDILKLKNITEKNNCLASCPRLIHRDSSIQNSIGYFDSFVKNPINCLFLRPRFVDGENINKNTSVDFCIFAAVLIHRSVINEIGLLDERFYFYFEDIDYSYQLFKNKIPILYVADVTITHFGGISADKDKVQKNINYQKGINILLRKNRGLLIQKLNEIFKFLR